MNKLSRRSTILRAGAFLLPIPTAVSTEAYANVSAPFGLTWGMSSEEARKTGAQLSANAGRSDYGASFAASNLSKVLSDTESVSLFFGYKDKLWRIAAAGRPMGPDPSGRQAVARYQELATVLSDRYGRGVETDVRDREVWKGPNEYVMSIKQGRGFLYTNFHSSDDVDVELSVRAASSDQAYYLILFAYRPGAREFETDKKVHEKEAL
jgi:hypothetical protein